MPWFHPKTILDKSYVIGIVLKGINGTLELVGGLLLLVVPPFQIGSLARTLTQSELAENPHDFIATHVLHYGQQLAQGHSWFAVIFLLTHGIVKVSLVVALLRNKLWAYPWALVALMFFLVYQMYLLAVQPSWAMIALTVLDIVIIALVWREWRQVTAK